MPEKRKYQFKYRNRIQLPCECGCGTIIWNYDQACNGPKRFAKNHQNRGKFHFNWKGYCMSWGGYKLIRAPDHPFVDVRGYVREHRLVWEKHNNAILLPWADVHHLDGNKLNNDITNLYAMMRKQHSAMLHTRVRAPNGRFASGTKSAD